MALDLDELKDLARRSGVSDYELCSQYRIWKAKEPVRILIIGKAGSGKSSLVNSLLGEEVASVCTGPVSTSQEVEMYSGIFADVVVTIYVTRKLDRATFDALRRKLEGLDITFICHEAFDRFHEGYASIITNSIECFKDYRDIWTRTILILTKSNVLPSEVEESDYPIPLITQVQRDVRSKYTTAIVDGGVQSSVAEAIPIVPTGKSFNTCASNLELEFITSNWIADLSLHCILRCKEEPVRIDTTSENSMCVLL